MILHILDPGINGGRERVVQSLAVAQRKAGSDVAVVAVVEPWTDSSAFSTPLESAGVPFSCLVVPPRRYLQERAKLAWLLGKLRPAILHTHGYRPDVVDAPVARRLGIATVSTVHGFTGGDGKNRVYEWMQRRALKRMQAVVAVSRSLAEDLATRGVRCERLHVIPNAWVRLVEPLDRHAARAALEVGHGEFHLGWVGRLSYEKGPDLLVEALARLNTLPLKASFVGHGPQDRFLRSRADELSLAHRILWHGSITDAARFFPAFDVLVLSSRTEGTPVVLLEAMASGIPIVATAVGGVLDLLDPAEAILVAPNDPVALAAGVRAVCEDPSAARARAAAARRRLFAHHDAEAWVGRYKSVYQQVQSRIEKVT